MDERWVIQYFKHELFTIAGIFFQDVFRTCDTFIEGSPIEKMGLEVAHVASNMVWELAKVSRL